MIWIHVATVKGRPLSNMSWFVLLFQWKTCEEYGEKITYTNSTAQGDNCSRTICCLKVGNSFAIAN